MYSIVYTTIGDMEDAEKLAKTLLKKELIACANYFDIRSTYRWKGEITSGSEVAVILKTKEDLVPQLIDTIEKVHPYEVPCAIEISIKDGYTPYLDWIDSQTL